MLSTLKANLIYSMDFLKILPSSNISIQDQFIIKSHQNQNMYIRERNWYNKTKRLTNNDFRNLVHSSISFQSRSGLYTTSLYYIEHVSAGCCSLQEVDNVYIRTVSSYCILFILLNQLKLVAIFLEEHLSVLLISAPDQSGRKRMYH